MAGVLIPSGDLDLLSKCGHWSRMIASDPASYLLTQDDAEALTIAVENYGVAFRAARNGSQSRAATAAKEQARKQVAEQMQRCWHLILANRKSIGPGLLTKLDIVTDSSPRKRHCPQEPPELRFVRALHEGNGALPMHELKFRGINIRTKPRGAAGLALYAELVGPDEKVPHFPGDLYGGRPWHLGTYSRSPIRLPPPMARTPMLVVYWGRWMDLRGNFGPYCKTVTSRVEGWMSNVPNAIGLGSMGKQQQLIANPIAQPAHRDEKYSIAIIEAQQAANNPQLIDSPQPRLEDQSEAA